MRRILLIFKNDVKRRLKSPLTVLVLLLTPILMTGIMGAIFAPRADQNQLPKIKMLLVDKDKNIGSKVLLGAFDAGQLKEMFEITLVDEAKGKKLISKGKASALVIIPEKFSERLIKAEKSQFIVIKNPSEQFLPGVVEEFMNTYAVIISGIVQVFEPEIRAVDLLIVVIGVLLFNISWGNYGYLFLLVAVTCFWIAAFFALLNAFFKNRNQAGAFTAPIIMVFSAFGGSLVQVDQLPKSVNWIADFTINHWFIQGTQQIRDGVLPALLRMF